MDSLLLNHPFLDGNKRVAFFLTDIFLRMNDYTIDVDAKKANAFIHSYLSNGERTHEQLSTWVRSHLRKL